MPRPFNSLAASASASQPFSSANSASSSPALMPSSSLKSGYQSRLAKNVEGMIHIFGGEEGKKLTARNVKIIREIAERTESIERGVEALVDARKVANKIESEREKAVAYHDTVAPKMEEIRYQIDKLELLVADELWTLPKYRELLFIR